MEAVMVDWDHVPYFESKEFDDPDVPGSGKYISPVLLEALVKLRKDTEWPIVIHAAVGGAVDFNGTHGHAPHSYHRLDQGAMAVDFHFKTKADARLQFYAVRKHSFTGVGIYLDWKWKGMPLPIGFHVDTRPVERNQMWKREKGKYLYFLP